MREKRSTDHFPSDVDEGGTSVDGTDSEGVVPLGNAIPLLLPHQTKRSVTKNWTSVVASEPQKYWPAESGRRRHSVGRVQVAACVVVVL